MIMTDQSTIISIDCGTQSLRVIIFAEDGSSALGRDGRNKTLKYGGVRCAQA